MATIDPRFIIELKGKSFVLFSGLLDLAHQAGLRSIETEAIAELCDPENEFWVVKATGRFRDENGEDALWSAYGDAGKANSQMRGAYLRHAETRAAARMLRMATNVGMCSVEELDDVQDSQAPARGASSNGHAARSPAAVRVSPEADRRGARPLAAASAPGRADQRAMVADVPDGAPCCSVTGCGAVLEPPEVTASQKHFGGTPYCQQHGRAALAALRAQAENAAAA